MKKPRWRKVIKITERHASHLMDKYYCHEHCFITTGQSLLSETAEIELLTTLHNYSNTIHRLSKIEMSDHPKEWINELWNFAD